MSLKESMMRALSASSMTLVQCRSLMTTTSAYSPQSGNFIQRLNKRLSDRKKPVVAVINMVGSIAPNMGSSTLPSKRLNLETMKPLIDKAFSHRDLKAVLMNINSPGGSASQSELISAYLRRKLSELKCPSVAFVEDYALSGGYWLASTADEVYATRNSIVGSIGALVATFGFNEMMGKLGIERRAIVSGNNKNILDPFATSNEDHVRIVNSMVKEVHANFIEHVKSNRASRLKANDEELFNGEFWIAKRALELGLIDGLRHMDEYIDNQFGDEVRVVHIRSKSDNLQKMFGLYQSPIIGNESNYYNSNLARAVHECYYSHNYPPHFN